MTRSHGFSLVEVLIVLAIIGLLTTLAVPGVLNARRQANETSAMASMRAIADAQAVYAASCANGDYASTLTQLGRAPDAGGPPFLSADLGQADVVEKSGYRLTLMRGSDGDTGRDAACNHVPAHELTSSYYVTAEPTVSGGTGDRFYWLGMAAVIYGDNSPIVETEGRSTAPGGAPVQNAPGDPRQRRRNQGDPPPMVVP
ncbi:MAG: type II secretion system protein [Vicinamibacterales bacterium]